jgi:N-acetyltransferase
VARKLRPVTLSGLLVRLEPLEAGHVGQLAAVGLEPELWRLQPRVISSTADMRAYVREALDEQRRGVSLPFAIVDLRSRLIIGSTRFMDIALPHRRLEIGATWLTPAAQPDPRRPAHLAPTQHPRKRAAPRQAQDSRRSP